MNKCIKGFIYWTFQCKSGRGLNIINKSESLYFIKLIKQLVTFVQEVKKLVYKNCKQKCKKKITI